MRHCARCSPIPGAYPDRVPALDAEAALHARCLARHARTAGIAVGFADVTVRAVTRAYGLVVATRNVRDFAPMGIPTPDPSAA
jgi:hypothetical protein